jgi:hypothetical protein
MATATEQTQITSSIPKYAEPYAQYLLGNVFGNMDPTTNQWVPGLIGEGYQRYGGQTVAGFNPLQKQAMEGAAGMQVAPQIGEASGLAGLAGRRAGELGQYSPMGNQQFYQGPNFREGQVDFERVGAERFGPNAMREYMSPYMGGVVESQKKGAVRDFMRQLPGMGSAASKYGALGGTRHALMQSEAQRSLSDRLADIESTGLQQAYQQATQQFGADRAAQMQAGQSNQAAQLQAQQQRLGQLTQANQFGLQNAAQGAQYGLAGAQLGEQSRQFGAGLGLQGLQQQLAASGQLGQLGQMQHQQGLGINQTQMGAGGQMQAMEQQLLNQQLQDFINAQQFPYKQAEFGMGILRGIPAGNQTQTLYQQPGSLFGQIAGVGLGLGSLFGGLGGGGGR